MRTRAGSFLLASIASRLLVNRQHRGRPGTIGRAETSRSPAAARRAQAARLDGKSQIRSNARLMRIITDERKGESAVWCFMKKLETHLVF